MICAKCQLWTDPQQMYDKLCWACADKPKNPDLLLGLKQPIKGRAYFPVLAQESALITINSKFTIEHALQAILGDPPPGYECLWFPDNSQKRQHLPHAHTRLPWLFAVAVADIRDSQDDPEQKIFEICYAQANEVVSVSGTWPWAHEDGCKVA